MVYTRRTRARDTSEEATDSRSSEEPFSSMPLKRRRIEEKAEGSILPSLSDTNCVSNEKKRKAKEDSEVDPEQSPERRVQVQRRKRRKVAEEKTTSSHDYEGTARPRRPRRQCSRSKAAKEAEEEEKTYNDHHVIRLKGGGFRPFQKKYRQNAQIGQGGFGSVFDGVRKSDGLSVAIKRIAKSGMIYAIVMDEPGEEHVVPLEVVLMHRAGGDQSSLGQKYGVSLIEWFELMSQVIIVMEKPEGSINLREFIVKKKNGRLSEKKAKDMIRQVICATKDMLANNVFHRDLKCENVLVQPSDSGDRVRIVDFGCGSPLGSVYNGYYAGTFSYAPPEYYMDGLYNAKSTCVWQVGALLFELLVGDFNTRDYMMRSLKFKRRVSKECCNFLTTCLELQPLNRLQMDELLSHPWF